MNMIDEIEGVISDVENRRNLASGDQIVISTLRRVQTGIRKLANQIARKDAEYLRLEKRFADLNHRVYLAETHISVCETGESK